MGPGLVIVASTLLLSISGGLAASPSPAASPGTSQAPHNCHAATLAGVADRSDTSAEHARLTTAEMVARVLRYMPHPDGSAAQRVYAALSGAGAVAAAPHPRSLMD
jgi:hypothetical protein